MDEVDLILNLHDGSGFYRPKYYDWKHCPDRWGQSIIIDQENVDTPKHGNLGNIARQVIQNVNRRHQSKTYLSGKKYQNQGWQRCHGKDVDLLCH